MSRRSLASSIGLALGLLTFSGSAWAPHFLDWKGELYEFNGYGDFWLIDPPDATTLIDLTVQCDQVVKESDQEITLLDDRLASVTEWTEQSQERGEDVAEAAREVEAASAELDAAKSTHDKLKADCKKLAGKVKDAERLGDLDPNDANDKQRAKAAGDAVIKSARRIKPVVPLLSDQLDAADAALKRIESRK